MVLQAHPGGIPNLVNWGDVLLVLLVLVYLTYVVYQLVNWEQYLRDA